MRFAFSQFVNTLFLARHAKLLGDDLVKTNRSLTFFTVRYLIVSSKWLKTLSLQESRKIFDLLLI